MKISTVVSIAASLIASVSFANSYQENPSTNTIILENTVDVYSSRQNVWVCGVAVAFNEFGINNTVGTINNVGSDNRVYFTASTYEKGRDFRNNVSTLLSSENLVIEAGTANNSYGYTSSSNYSNNKTFNKTTETRISNIRVELASLNYGAEVTVSYCGETPFAYTTKPDHDLEKRKQYNLDVNVHHQVLDVDASSDEYRFQGDLSLANDLFWHTTVNEVDAENGSLWNDGSNHHNQWLEFYSTLGSQTLPNTNSLISQYYKYIGRDPYAAGVGSQDVRKWIVHTKFLEGAVGTPRLKGLTERVVWRTRIDSTLDVTTHEAGNQP